MTIVTLNFPNLLQYYRHVIAQQEEAENFLTALHADHLGRYVDLIKDNIDPDRARTMRANPDLLNDMVTEERDGAYEECQRRAMVALESDLRLFSLCDLFNAHVGRGVDLPIDPEIAPLFGPFAREARTRIASFLHEADAIHDRAQSDMDAPSDMKDALLTYVYGETIPLGERMEEAGDHLAGKQMEAAWDYLELAMAHLICAKNEAAAHVMFVELQQPKAATRRARNKYAADAIANDLHFSRIATLYAAQACPGITYETQDQPAARLGLN